MQDIEENKKFHSKEIKDHLEKMAEFFDYNYIDEE